MKRPTAASVGSKNSLARLHELACLDAQRPGNIGAGLKVLEALMNLEGYRPAKGGRA
ncbi:hypothetical protein [Deinococcus marmoris]|uniref:hypothetical protein n=1 Tax=Deinococcus marmoris TaxID=249408 RepID=UPI00158EC5DC|nr:hypothetical protein [Deinococcus marmoris]